MIRYLCTQSSGGGSSYIKTTLNDTPNILPDGNEILLSQDFDNFDELQFFLCVNDNGLFNYFNVISIPKEVLVKSYEDSNNTSITQIDKGRFGVTISIYAGNWYACTWQLVAKYKNKLVCAHKDRTGWTASVCTIYKIVGVKYG